MKISKYYEENFHLDPNDKFIMGRVGLTITSDKEVTKEQAKVLSAEMLNLAKTLVQEEIALVKGTRGA